MRKESRYLTDSKKRQVSAVEGVLFNGRVELESMIPSNLQPIPPPRVWHCSVKARDGA